MLYLILVSQFTIRNVKALKNCKMNCLYSVLPGKLEVIILIILINSGGTDSPVHKSSSLSRTGFFFISYCFLVRIYQKGWQFSCHQIAGRNVDICPLKMFTLYCLSTKISVSVYYKGWQFSCHLIIGRTFKDLSLENVHLILF